MRLHIKLTADVHASLDKCRKDITKSLRQLAQDDGTIPPYAAGMIADSASDAWRIASNTITGRFMASRRQSTLIGFAALPYWHIKKLVPAIAAELQESGPPHIGIEPLAFFQPQLDEILTSTANRVYGDGFKLSDRIWNLDQRSLAGIQAVLHEGITSGNSAWNIAQKLEGHLGAGSDCPRWAKERLFKLTKTDIAGGDKTGLIKGNPCASSGVSYNALRLARNEIQIVHSAATDEIFRRQPWVKKEKINLSPSHPPIGCECEDIVDGGENGDGVYPLGEIALPVHVHCLCFKSSVSMTDSEFSSGLRGWLNGSESWAEMDNYATWVGATSKTIAAAEMTKKLTNQLALPMLRWLGGSEKEINTMLEN